MKKYQLQNLSLFMKKTTTAKRCREARKTKIKWNLKKIVRFVEDESQNSDKIYIKDFYSTFNSNKIM